MNIVLGKTSKKSWGKNGPADRLGGSQLPQIEALGLTAFSQFFFLRLPLPRLNSGLLFQNQDRSASDDDADFLLF